MIGVNTLLDDFIQAVCKLGLDLFVSGLVENYFDISFTVLTML